MKPVLSGARVALIYSPGTLRADYASSLLRGIETGLRQIGASVSTFNLALHRPEIVEIESQGPAAVYPSTAWVIQDCVAFLRSEGSGQWDYCLGLFHDAYLQEPLMEALREHCKVIINYPLNLLDQPHRFERALTFCDLTFCAEEEACARLTPKHGDRIRYVPMAADSDIHRPLLGPPHEPRLLFVGSFYADRLQRLERCSRRLPTSIHGGGLDVPAVLRGMGRELLRNGRWTSPTAALRLLRMAASRDRNLILSDEEYVRLAATHGVSIGFSEVTQEKTGAKVHKVRLRDYEATMCGMCHLATRLPELERGFEPDREILLYDNFDQALELLTRIRTGDIDWRAIGMQARRRAAHDHTWAVRLEQAFA